MTEARQRTLRLILLLVSITAPACGNNAPGTGPAPGRDNTGDRGPASGGAGENPGAGGGAGGLAADGDPSSVVDGGAPSPPSGGTPDAKPADPLNLSACKLLQTGPFVPIVGQTGFSLMAPAIKDDQQAYRISIAKRNPAHVSFMVPAAGVYVIYTNTAAPLVVFALDGEMVEVSNLRMSIPECPEVKGRHTFTLKMEGQIIRFGPDPAAASVDVVIAAAI